MSPTEADGVACVDVSDPKTGDELPPLRLRVPAGAAAQRAAGRPGDRLGVEDLRRRPDRRRDQRVRGAPRASSGFSSAEPPPCGRADGRGRGGADPGGGRAPAEESAEDIRQRGRRSGRRRRAAKTATFVPDPAMLDSAPEPTPVAPLDLAKLAADAVGAGGGAHRRSRPRSPAQAIAELPSDALDSEPVSAPRAPRRRPVAPRRRRGAARRRTPPSRAGRRISTARCSRRDSPPAVSPPPAAEERTSRCRRCPVQVAVAPPPRRLRAPPAARARGGRDVGVRRRGSAGAQARRSRRADRDRRARAAGRGRRHRLLGLEPPARGGGAAGAARAGHVARRRRAVYRWFSGRGQVTDYETTTLAFANPGRLAELLPAGTEVAAGDVVGKLAGASGLETLLAHDRSRVGFYKQLRDSMRAAGNRAEERQAEMHLAEKQKLVEMALAGLTKFTVAAHGAGRGGRDAGQDRDAGRAGRAGRAGQGAPPSRRVRAGRRGARRAGQDGLLPRRGGRPRPARVERSAAAARRPRRPPTRARPTRRSGRASSTASRRATPPRPPARSRSRCRATWGWSPGQPLRLARRRYDAVFPVPAGAVVADGDRRSVWIAGRDGTAELREVTDRRRRRRRARQRRAAGGRSGDRRPAGRAARRHPHRARALGLSGLRDLGARRFDVDADGDLLAEREPDIAKLPRCARRLSSSHK